MAEFSQPEPLLDAARRAHAEGYRNMDAYSPMPVEGLAEAIGFRSNWVQRLVFVGGLLRSDRRIHAVLVDDGGRISAQSSPEGR